MDHRFLIPSRQLNSIGTYKGKNAKECCLRTEINEECQRTEAEEKKKGGENSIKGKKWGKTKTNPAKEKEEE